MDDLDERRFRGAMGPGARLEGTEELMAGDKVEVIT